MFSEIGGKEGKLSKFQQIVDIISEIRTKEDEISGDRYSEYSIFVSGHSLGGALSQLLAFALAFYSTRDHLPQPITAITIASPQVGNRVWLTNFKQLEKEGFLRHIRLSNDGDRVCVIPSLGYFQTGVNIHLYPNRKASIEYCKQWPRWSAIQCSSIGKMHLVCTYLDRLLLENNKDILSKSVEQLYEESVYGEDRMKEINELKSLLAKGDHVAAMYRDFFTVREDLNGC